MYPRALFSIDEDEFVSVVRASNEPTSRVHCPRPSKTTAYREVLSRSRLASIWQKGEEIQLGLLAAISIDVEDGKLEMERGRQISNFREESEMWMRTRDNVDVSDLSL